MRFATLLASFAAVVGFTSAQSLTNQTADWGNGVHIPGAIPANQNEPLQHHVAFGKDGTSMYISWASFAHLDTPTVLYGTNPSNLNLVATSSESRIYPTSRTYNNHVKLTNLQPGTKYYYQVSYTNAAYAAYRPKYTFKTALPAGDRTPFSVATFGDLGLMGHDGLSTAVGPLDSSTNSVLGTNETNTIQSLLQTMDSYDFIAHFGDIGYADYFLKASTLGYYGNTTYVPSPDYLSTRYESLLEQFYDQMEPITAYKPWMVSPGNHEANCDNGGSSPKSGPGKNNYTDAVCMVGQTNFTFFIEKFRMPGPDSGGVGNFWYSYDYGMAHFISLDTETDLGHGLAGPIQNATNNHNGPFGVTMNAQVDWLINDLKKVNRKKTPWVVVFLHRPWYTSVSPPTTPPAWQTAFEQIFYDYGVDIYMQGHVHVYERFSPRFNGTIDPNGYNNPRAPWPIVAGAAGHYDGLDTFTNTTVGSVGFDTFYGWSRLSILDEKNARVDYYASANSTIVDSQTIFKRHNPSQD